MRIFECHFDEKCAKILFNIPKYFTVLKNG